MIVTPPPSSHLGFLAFVALPQLFHNLFCFEPNSSVKISKFWCNLVLKLCDWDTQIQKKIRLPEETAKIIELSTEHLGSASTHHSA